MSENIKNYYEVLEIPVNATQDEVREAYQRAKNAYSGDSLALYSLLSEDEATKISNLIEEAYNILSDPLKRKKYNQVRGINFDPNVTPEEIQDASPQEFQPAEKKADMNRLVAKKRYSLEFNEDPEMEKEIEQCTEFTGEFLQKVREYKNVDVNRLADMTKISKTYIRYIEDEEFGKMPAPVYVRGFVYQYAKCLKLNPDLVATSYLFRMKKMKGNP